MLILIKEMHAYPVESNTAVFSERTGLGVNRDGGRGDAERISFLMRVGDLKDKVKSKIKLSLTVLIKVTQSYLLGSNSVLALCRGWW